jgi:alpha-N-acetylglucosamine transferase
MVFAMAFDSYYSTMGRSVINALNFYHNNPSIFIYTPFPKHELLARVEADYPNVRLIPAPQNTFHYGEWHPLIWSKIEVFNLPIDDCVVFLDADVIVYNNLQKYCDRFLKSGKAIGASADFAPFIKQFNSGFDFHQFFFKRIFTNDAYLSATAFNAGALIVRPDSRIYQELIRLAHDFHKLTFYPEQAILNLYCFLNDGWEDLEDFSIMPFSSSLVGNFRGCGVLHFFTPRPAFMLEPIERSGEPTLNDMTNWFEAVHGTSFPLRQIEKDYLARLNNKLI